MKVAELENGKQVCASKDAPSIAKCPFCKGKVTLRKRQTMGKEITYYWRHIDRINPECPARWRLT